MVHNGHEHPEIAQLSPRSFKFAQIGAGRRRISESGQRMFTIAQDRERTVSERGMNKANSETT